jgi:hypothetical protein
VQLGRVIVITAVVIIAVVVGADALGLANRPEPTGPFAPTPTPEHCQPGPDCDDIWVMVVGPRDWMPSTEYTLELDSAAYEIDRLSAGGVVSVQTCETLQVRLIRLADCTSFAAFQAEPGSKWVIRFDSDEVPTPERLPEGQPIELGPALVEGRVSGCP